MDGNHDDVVDVDEEDLVEDYDEAPFRSYDEVCIDIESIFGTLTKEMRTALDEMTPRSKKAVFRRVGLS